MIAARAYCSFEVEDHTFTLLSSAIFLSTLWVIYMIRFKLKPTYSKELDSMPLYSLVIKPHAPPGIPLLYSLSLSNSFPCMHAWYCLDFQMVPSAILAVLIHPRHFHHRLLTRIIWSFSFYLGAISVLPQLRLMQNAKVN